MTRRRISPRIEIMEARNLLSSTAFLPRKHPAIAAAAVQAFDINGPAGIPLGQGTPNQYLAPTGTPNPGEVRRQAFTFTFSGAFAQTAGRYSDEASRIRIDGVGRSTYFLHGDIQLGAVVPTDLSRPTAGQSASFDKNVNSNSVFGFDLDGSTANLDAAGRPTHFIASTDVNLSSGTFVESQSRATVDIRYFPDGKPHRAGTSSGRATIVVRGFAYTLGTGNILNGAIRRTGDRPSKVSVA